MFKTSQERAKENFGLTNLREDVFVSDINDPAKGCNIVNKYINQTDESACSYDDYPVPLPNLKHVALCCPTMPKAAHL
ncbi:hypothetical protein [Wolbachia endosymbiont (group E) of Neria commutata]|uniref:hypothetical protein n=1 Tax=Wolbachia endosymbiont (group E) of Neria commutata TaxID=3066149 RepID=UPI003132AF83